MKIEDVVHAATNTYSLPDVCIKLRQAIDDPKSNLDDIANIISTDPLLCAKLLKLANSALFRFTNQVETISKALSVLGMEATYNLVMADTAGQMKNAFKSELIDIDTYWNNSLFTGVVAKELARKSRIRGTERFFVMGILCNLSELVIASNFENKYARYNKNKETVLPWVCQSAEFGFTFANASSKICEAWGLPVGLHFPLEKTFDVSAKKTERDTAIIQLATKVILQYQTQGNFETVESLEPEYSLWQHSDEDLQDMVDFCEKETRRLQSYF